MEVEARLEALLALAEAIGLDVRRESLGGESGGLCQLKGRRVMFVDLAADLETRYERTLASLAPLPELEGRFIPPEIREDLARVHGMDS